MASYWRFFSGEGQSGTSTPREALAPAQPAVIEAAAPCALVSERDTRQARALCLELGLSGGNREPMSRDVKAVAIALAAARAEGRREGWRRMRKDIAGRFVSFPAVAEAITTLPDEPPEDEPRDPDAAGSRAPN